MATRLLAPPISVCDPDAMKVGIEVLSGATLHVILAPSPCTPPPQRLPHNLNAFALYRGTEPAAAAAVAIKILFTVGASPFYSTKTGLRVAKVTVFHPDFRE